MNYIYDIVLNFNPEYYDFYEWKKNDNIINVRKIPSLKIKEQDYLSLKYNKVTLDQPFIQKIKNNSSIYLDDNIYNIICVVTNGKEALGVSFDEEGNITGRSSLLFDEEQEIIEEATRITITPITFIKNIKITPHLSGRVEKEKKQYLQKYFHHLQPTTDDITLQYLYYEYFEKEQSDSQTIKRELLKEIKKDWNTKLDTLYQLALLLNQIKQ